MEANLIHRALENLYAASGIVGETQVVEQPDSSTDAFDGMLRLMHKSHALEIPFVVKKQLSLRHIDWLKSLNEEAIIIFDKAPNSVKDRLRVENLSYLASSGNAFLSRKNFFLFINFEKEANSAADKKGKAFSKTGLKIIYALLSNTNATETNYRHLAELAGASIDSVGRVLRELVKDEYLVKNSKRGFKITDRKRLLNDWTTMFNKTLRPKLKSRVFDFQDDNTALQSLVGQDIGGIIGGELAAESMENQLISRKANIYVAGSFVDFALKNKLKPTRDGRITLIEKFWNKSDNYWELTEFLASPILVYADLLSEPNPRNLEAANHIVNRNFYESVQ